MKGYQYSDILLAMVGNFFYGGNRTEDINVLKSKMPQRPGFQICSPDTMLRAMTELADENVHSRQIQGKAPPFGYISSKKHKVLYHFGANFEKYSYFCNRKGIKLYYHMSNNLSKYIKEMRKQCKLTQVDLADKSGVGLRFVREMEQGKQTLRLDKVNQVLALFGKEMGPVDAPRILD